MRCDTTQAFRPHKPKKKNTYTYSTTCSRFKHCHCARHGISLCAFFSFSSFKFSEQTKREHNQHQLLKTNIHDNVLDGYLLVGFLCKCTTLSSWKKSKYNITHKTITNDEYHRTWIKTQWTCRQRKCTYVKEIIRFYDDILLNSLHFYSAP